MASDTIPYRRLPGRAKQFFGVVTPARQSLWLGPDHVLLVSSQYYSERYKRFYFKDIQAITITRTAAGMLLTVALGLLTGFFLLWTVLAYTSLGWGTVPAMVIGGIAVVWAAFMGLNALFGPTCRCYLYTAVHCEELTCLGRLRTARRTVQSLRAIVQAEQGGTLSDADLEVLRTRQGDVYAPPPKPVEPSAPGKTPLRREAGTMHMALFAVLIIDAVASVIALIQPAAIPTAVSLILFITIIVLTVWALIRQKDSTLPRQLRSVTWATFFYICLIVIFLLVNMTFDQITQEMGNQDAPPGFAAFQTQLGQLVSAISIFFDVLLSAFGFRVMWKYRNRSDVATAPSDSPLSEQE